MDEFIIFITNMYNLPLAKAKQNVFQKHKSSLTLSFALAN